MFSYKEKTILINEHQRQFDYPIRDVIRYNELFIVLLGIPFDKDYINNIFCLDDTANIVWQAEDISNKYDVPQKLPYEQMAVDGERLFASDFYGRCFVFEANTGRVLDRKLVK